jgi:hypothetical protein
MISMAFSMSKASRCSEVAYQNVSLTSQGLVSQAEPIVRPGRAAPYLSFSMAFTARGD